ncbi:hypothetical protein [Nocardia cyriacigeorgica]|uniref:hypothetical protein n=1 Tax=Nocardia cyriacigeorgica TaxID=135487 RepID=UPI0024586E2F|nr:hypothetical protein [Nocardia cyriacigeorgica]
MTIPVALSRDDHQRSPSSRHAGAEGLFERPRGLPILEYGSQPNEECSGRR